MKKLKIRKWYFGAILILAVSVMFSISMVNAEEPITIVFESVAPVTHSRLGQETPIGEYMDAVERESGGRIKIERHWSGEPVPSKEALDGLSRGVIDMLLASPNYYSGRCAIGDIAIMPNNFRTIGDIFDIWWNTPVGKIIDEVYQKRENVKILMPLPYGNYVIQMRKGAKKIRTLEDFKGLKMRAAGGAVSKAVKKLGASPVQTIGGDYYTAMQRGTIDAGIMPLYTYKTYNIFDVSDQAILPNILPQSFTFIWVNLDTWKKLGPELQKLMIQTSRAMESRIEAFMAVSDFHIQKQCIEKGVEFYTLSPEDSEKMFESLADSWDLYVDTNEKNGLGDEARKIREIVEKRFNREWF